MAGRTVGSCWRSASITARYSPRAIDIPSSTAADRPLSWKRRITRTVGSTAAIRRKMVAIALVLDDETLAIWDSLDGDRSAWVRAAMVEHTRIATVVKGEESLRAIDERHGAVRALLALASVLEGRADAIGDSVPRDGRQAGLRDGYRVAAASARHEAADLIDPPRHRAVTPAMAQQFHAEWHDLPPLVGIEAMRAPNDLAVEADKLAECVRPLWAERHPDDRLALSEAVDHLRRAGDMLRLVHQQANARALRED